MADDNDDGYSLVHSFRVDDGSLDNMKPHECFAYDVEWEMFRQKLESGEPFSESVHTVIYYGY